MPSQKHFLHGGPRGDLRRRANSRCGPSSSRYAASATFSAWRAFCSTIRMAIPVALMSRTSEKTSRTTSGASPSDGSSISNSRGPLISARAIATICCSPPDSDPANCLRRSRRRGNRSNISSIRRSTSARADSQPAEPQIVVHRHGVPQTPRLRHPRNAEPMDAMRRQRAQIMPIKTDRPGTGLVQPEDSTNDRRLAGAIRAENDTQLARIDVERHPPHRRHGTIGNLEITDLEQHAQTTRRSADKRSAIRVFLAAERHPLRSAARQKIIINHPHRDTPRSLSDPHGFPPAFPPRSSGRN